MLNRTRLADMRLLARRCLACGYDGSLLRGGQAPRCARCGCDLRERPARSYAEMEGLVGHPLTLDAPLDGRRREQRLIQRWVAFLFVAILGLLLLAWLTTAVVP